MNYRKAVIALSVLLFLFIDSNAQSDRSFIAKWSPASLAAGKLTLGGEYNFKRKSSIELIVGIPVTRTHSFDFDGNESDLDTKAFSILAGYRYYFGRRGLRGLYIEPYAKYLHHEGSGILEGSLSGETARFDTRSDYKGVGLGAQLGVQFLIAKRVAIDLFLLGPEANSAEFSLTGTDIASNIPWTLVKANEAEQDIRDALDDIPIIGDKVKVEVNQNTKTIRTSYNGFLPGFRFGASVGFRF